MYTMIIDYAVSVLLQTSNTCLRIRFWKTKSIAIMIRNLKHYSHQQYSHYIPSASKDYDYVTYDYFHLKHSFIFIFVVDICYHNSNCNSYFYIMKNWYNMWSHNHNINKKLVMVGMMDNIYTPVLLYPICHAIYFWRHNLSKN